MNDTRQIGQYGAKNKNKIIFSLLMKKLNLSPKEFYEKVFIKKVSPHSLNNLLFINQIRSAASNSSPVHQNQSKDCYFIFDIKANKGQSSEFNTFLNDKTINRISEKHIPLTDHNLLEYFHVYVYRPNFNQPCYNNSFNSFITEPKVRDILFNSYGIDKTNDQINIRQISENINYDSNSYINSLDNQYIAYDQRLRIPIQFLIKISTENGQSTLSVEINYYSFSRDQYIFNLKQMNLLIETKPFLASPSISKKFEVISPTSWIAHYTSTNSYSNKLYWKRQFDLPKDFRLKKDLFRISVSWDAEYPFRDSIDLKAYNGSFELIKPLSFVSSTN
jgi:hypothetical protein